MSVHTPKHSKTNRDTDLSYPTAPPRGHETRSNPTQTQPGTQPRLAFPRLRRRPRASVSARCPPTPTGRHTINAASRRPQRRMIPKTKTNKPPSPRKTRESTAQGRRSRLAVSPSPSSHYSPLDPPPAAAPGRRSSHRGSAEAGWVLPVPLVSDSSWLGSCWGRGVDGWIPCLRSSFFFSLLYICLFGEGIQISLCSCSVWCWILRRVVPY